MTIAEGLMALFSVMLVIFSGMQVRVMRHMHCSTHRPRLRVRNISVVDVEDLLEKGPEAEHQPEFDVVNVGGTTAYLTSYDCQIVLADQQTKRPHEVSQRLHIHNESSKGVHKIAAGETLHLSVLATQSYTREDIARFTFHVPVDVTDKGNNLEAYAQGVLVYSDPIKLKRKTAFFRRYDRTAKRFDHTGDSEKEYED